MTKIKHNEFYGDSYISTNYNYIYGNRFYDSFKVYGNYNEIVTNSFLSYHISPVFLDNNNENNFTSHLNISYISSLNSYVPTNNVNYLKESYFSGNSITFTSSGMIKYYDKQDENILNTISLSTNNWSTNTYNISGNTSEIYLSANSYSYISGMSIYSYQNVINPSNIIDYNSSTFAEFPENSYVSINLPLYYVDKIYFDQVDDYIVDDYNSNISVNIFDSITNTMKYFKISTASSRSTLEINTNGVLMSSMVIKCYTGWPYIYEIYPSGYKILGRIKDITISSSEFKVHDSGNNNVWYYHNVGNYYSGISFASSSNGIYQGSVLIYSSMYDYYPLVNDTYPFDYWIYIHPTSQYEWKEIYFSGIASSQTPIEWYWNTPDEYSTQTFRKKYEDAGIYPIHSYARASGDLYCMDRSSVTINVRPDIGWTPYGTIYKEFTQGKLHVVFAHTDWE